MKIIVNIFLSILISVISLSVTSNTYEIKTYEDYLNYSYRQSNQNITPTYTIKDNVDEMAFSATSNFKQIKIISSIRTTEDYLINRKIPEVAVLCSVVFPGWGQYYAGNERAGADNFLLTMATTAIVFWKIDSRDFNGAFSWEITSLCIRVWDMFTAGNSANEYNKKLIEQIKKNDEVK